MGFPAAGTGSVIEDSGVSGGLISTSGDVDYTWGSDIGQWAAETISGAYGSSLVINNNGVWSYTANNDHPAIAALDDGEILTEVFTVTSNAGTSTITITIKGHTDPPCFVAGTMIETVQGPRPIETLRRGDLVLTRDHGPQPVSWIGASAIDTRDPERSDTLSPVRIRAGALGRGVPARDLLLSPMHRVLIDGPDTALLFGEPEVLCAAKHLVNGLTITREEAVVVEYHHMLFDRHQIVFSAGCASESFFPGHVGLDGFDDKTRAELFTFFPELQVLPESYGQAARQVLRGYEARLVRDRLLPEVADWSGMPLSAEQDQRAAPRLWRRA